MKQFDVITIFPPILDSYINESLFKRAQKNKILKIKMHNLRQWTADRHQTVDDKPYGGGPGMVMMPGPVFDCLEHVANLSPLEPHTILLTPQGRPFSHRIASELAEHKNLIFICGHYEGVDERFIDLCVDRELSIGDYVLTGGEIPAMVITDTVTRLIPNVIKPESLEEESHSDMNSEYPQYTRPEVYGKLKVPEVLLTGNHKDIKVWRQNHQPSRAKI